MKAGQNHDRLALDQMNDGMGCRIALDSGKAG
jgi:hypothetical protein